MAGNRSPLIRLLTLAGLAAGLANVTACVDPFRPDTTPVSPPAGASPMLPPTGTPPPATAPTETPPPAYDAALPPDAGAPAIAPDAPPIPVDAPPATPDAAVDAPAPPPQPADAAPERATPDKPDRPPPAPEEIANCPPSLETPPAGQVLTCPDDPKVLDAWLPVTPAVNGCRPLPHPARECQFYQFGWQNFLIATQPDAQGRPAFLSWNTIENTFGAGAGRPAPTVPVLTGGVTQAGGRQVLVDQNGHAVYYGIHFNQAFVDFVNANGLTSAQAVASADPNLTFPTTKGIVELKTAWMIVDDANPPANFITTRAKVSTLKVSDNRIEEERSNLRDVTVALIAMHVVFTLPGHPELIWSSFQHVDGSFVPDVAPSAAANPPVGGLRPTTILSTRDHLLYKGGTPASAANRGVVFGPMFDETTQTFAAAQISNIYRVFPGSSSATPQIDDDVSALTDNMIALFKAKKGALPASDKRPNYSIVGAVWQDRPDRSFKVDNVLVNAAGVNPDDPASLTGGEDSLSSTAMESFTQPADSFPNCFSCHDTRTATATGVPSARDNAAPVTLQPKMINVSHVFNEVVREGMQGELE